MDLGTESSKSPGDVTQGTSEEAPSNLPTVLIACGAVGGAVLVVLTIAVCRYCLGRRKGLKSDVRGDYGEGENFDINVHTLSDIPEDTVPTLVLSGGQLGVPDQSTQRRVSFQGVDLLDDDDSPLRRDSNKRRRYTEGDFHHLKKARLNKTLGLPAILKSASVDSPRPARETYPLLTITHADEMADEPESPKETDTESPGPDSCRSDRRKSSEVSVPVEVHRGSEPPKEGSGEQSAVRQFFRKLQKHASLDAVLPSQQKIQQWKTCRPWKSFDCQVLSSHPRPLLRQRAVSDPVERDPGKTDIELGRKAKNSSGRFQSTGSFQVVAGAEEAIILGRYLEANKDKVVDRKIIELGAGTGLTGIVASLLGAKVTITDTKEGLESTRINVGRNTRNVRHAPLVKQLKWGDDLHMYPTSDHYDYILGADIIYIEETFPDLLRTLRHLCDHDTVILLASKIRYERDERFFNMLRQEYDVRVIKEDREEEVKIYKATLPRNGVAAMPC
ncbi:uncharacterized protein LOC118431916 [Branchiostoma floridae]|uniref:Uncharacterized protein LOC118431916 n=1 Tax=Branchiostoma floridae TaxID=7739 RepID=A0A9J7ME44_BRAFL|nr:uncharacterized protein LOC118431916 [Branchiostoma floridae]